jgi:hypothetical protein
MHSLQISCFHVVKNGKLLCIQFLTIFNELCSSKDCSFFRDVLSWSLADKYQQFSGICCLHRHGPMKHCYLQSVISHMIIMLILTVPRPSNLMSINPKKYQVVLEPLLKTVKNSDQNRGQLTLVLNVIWYQHVIFTFNQNAFIWPLSEVNNIITRPLNLKFTFVPLQLLLPFVKLFILLI